MINNEYMRLSRDASHRNSRLKADQGGDTSNPVDRLGSGARSTDEQSTKVRCWGAQASEWSAVPRFVFHRSSTAGGLCGM